MQESSSSIFGQVVKAGKKESAAAEEEAGRGVREPVPVGGVGHEGAPRLGDTPEAAE